MRDRFGEAPVSSVSRAGGRTAGAVAQQKNRCRLNAIVQGDGTQGFCQHRTWTPVPDLLSHIWHLPPLVNWSRKRCASWPGLGPRGDGDAQRAGPQVLKPTRLRLWERQLSKGRMGPALGPAPDPTPLNRRREPKGWA